MKNKFIVTSTLVLAIGLTSFLSGCGGITDSVTDSGENADTSTEDTVPVTPPQAVPDYERTENPDYSNLIITYDETFDGSGADSELVAPYYYAEADCSCYIFGAHVTSLYAYWEDFRTYKDSLGAFGKSTLSMFDNKDFLEGAWGITDRDSAKLTIEEMLKYGHQAKCRAYIQNDPDTKKLIEYINTTYGDDFTFENVDDIDDETFKNNDISTDYFYQVKAAACVNALYGENGLAGYDYMRMLRVVTFSDDAWYLSTPEYLEYVYNLDLALQKQYSSFKEIHQCYYLGEMFRAAVVGEKDSLINMTEIGEAIKTMESEGFYDEIEPDFNISIVKDWDDILVTRKELREQPIGNN
ncbi:DUF1266 domain-containing protein [Butyrivibrio fibrisolvens]|uniref:DUF1266 domain-containing protein n=1 Tax=Pseudobutyrivibrio ruminis TaxID=46206 RepID=UPI0003FEA533|nr:DUF1266 domain-containing protein [Pseudobutyrivibrio ruminis]MDC7280090.1 DUF1266 domain-containing protein [Butyrivibrio fibrisolvens]